MDDRRPIRVLLIEDDPDDQLLTRDALAEAAPGCYVVTCAAHYAEGLAQLQRREHDVVLLDYRLGAHDGLDLLAEAHAAGCESPIIVLTGQGDRDVDEAVLRAGAADYLVKGQFTPELLDRSIRYTLVRERAARAEAANRVREEFVTTLSHDLQNPLAVIHGQAQLLLRRLTPAEPVDPQRLATGLRSIKGAAARAALLVNNLLDAARVQAGQPLALRRQPTDLVALVRQTLDEQVPVEETGPIQLEVTVPALEGEWDPEQLRRVLANLLSNAVKFSPQGGEIAVRVAAEPGWAMLTVRDRGLGIPPADLPHIFDRYYRGRNVAGTIAGTGLGLAGTRHVVEQHGGFIAVESAEGVGTVVSVRLPLTPPRASSDPARAASV
jgi:signal transduction histidine kinase